MMQRCRNVWIGSQSQSTCSGSQEDQDMQHPTSRWGRHVLILSTSRRHLTNSLHVLVFRKTRTCKHVQWGGWAHQQLEHVLACSGLPEDQDMQALSSETRLYLTIKMSSLSQAHRPSIALVSLPRASSVPAHSHQTINIAIDFISIMSSISATIIRIMTNVG